MAAKKKQNGIVPVNDSLVALRDFEGLSEVLAANTGGDPVGRGVLETIKVPSGGAPVFVTENEIDGVETVSEFEGLICWWADGRSWWAESIEEGESGARPACRSFDLVNGQGDNTIGQAHAEEGVTERYLCEECPNNRWSDNAVDNDNWCKTKRELFVLRMDRQDVVFPSVLGCPVTSIKGVKNYFTGLAARGIFFYAAVHKFTLVPAKSANGIDYSTVKISFVRKLEPEELRAVKGYADMMRQTFGSRGVAETEAEASAD